MLCLEGQPEKELEQLAKQISSPHHKRGHALLGAGHLSIEVREGTIGENSSAHQKDFAVVSLGAMHEEPEWVHFLTCLFHSLFERDEPIDGC